ncbi:VP39 [Diatraea saccharalis granulovirus]|uniref:VP39 n=1 Tax=Diatraea saccharalis granulovirus TaxID=1675862 RepID=A0A0R7EYZ4_9BBAC|nr:VP39 [Diatraea saccharalis granulovirus]AKN80743.1 VP39 [Diatraea saccharalis granulovirus]
MDIMDYSPCELNNYCIFQGVLTDLYRCDNYGTQCSADAYNSRFDGTFVCNYHLGKYFKIIKSRFEVPSGTDTRSFKMLIGQSLLSQDNPKRILIPLNHEEHFLTASRTAMEKLVFYTIYNEEDKVKALCEELIRQEYFDQPLWGKIETNINTIMSLANPSKFCTGVTPNENRVFNEQDNFAKFPPFLKNLINRLVRPRNMVINGIEIKLENTDTCSFIEKGLVVPSLHNPNRPVRSENMVYQPRFSMRTVVEFEGLATLEQRAIEMYDDVVLTRPLLNGTQKND